MLSFLPEEYKKELIKEYNKRFFSVLLFFISISLIVLLAILIFSYNVSQIQFDSANNQFELIKTTQAYKNRGELESSLNSAKLSLEKLKDLNTFSVYDSFRKIIERKNNQIKITGIQYVKSDEKNQFTIRGISVDRDSLLSYSKSLENEKMFSEVNLPISSYAKDKNIEFQIKLVINSIK